MKHAELIELTTASLGDLPSDASATEDDKGKLKSKKLRDIVNEAIEILAEDDPSLLKSIGRQLGGAAAELGKAYAGAGLGLAGGVGAQLIDDLKISDAIKAKMKSSAEFNKWNKAVKDKYPSGVTYMDDVSADGQNHLINAVVNDTGKPEIVARFDYTNMRIIPTTQRIPVPQSNQPKTTP